MLSEIVTNKSSSEERKLKAFHPMKQLILPLLLVAQAQASHPTFKWITTNHRSSSMPGFRVEFEDGSSDTALLSTFHPFGSRHRISQCLFTGTLEQEPTARIAVTGCPEDSDVQITLLSSKSKNQFRSVNGSLFEPVEDPWMQAHSIGIRDTEQWIAMDMDEVMNPTIEHEARVAFDTCQDCSIPPAHKLTLRLFYDQSLANKVSDPLAWIAKVTTHAQAFFLDPSLPTKIELQVVGEPEFRPHEHWTAETSLGTVRQYVAGDTDANLYAFLCADPEYMGTVGIAYVGAVCDKNFHTSITEWRKTEAATGKVFAHELGHNLGMAHDFDPKHSGKGCSGVMDYGDTPDTWSSCSANDFIAHFDSVLMYQGKHCMKSIDDTGLTNAPGTQPSTPTTPATAEPTFAPAGPTFAPTDCMLPDWVGDGFCDDENNVESCNFDQGDCCEKKHQNWNFFCNQCLCRDPSF